MYIMSLVQPLNWENVLDVVVGDFELPAKPIAPLSCIITFCNCSKE